MKFILLIVAFLTLTYAQSEIRFISSTGDYIKRFDSGEQSQYSRCSAQGLCVDIGRLTLAERQVARDRFSTLMLLGVSSETLLSAGIVGFIKKSGSKVASFKAMMLAQAIVWLQSIFPSLGGDLNVFKFYHLNKLLEAESDQESPLTIDQMEQFIHRLSRI